MHIIVTGENPFGMSVKTHLGERKRYRQTPDRQTERWRDRERKKRATQKEPLCENIFGTELCSEEI